MHSEDKPHFAKILGALAVSCGAELNEIVIKTYFEALRDMTLAQLERAGNQLFRTWPYPGKLPTTGNIRQAGEQSLELQSLAAMGTVVKAMGRTGVYGSVKFLDESLAATVETYGGWVEMLNSYRELRMSEAPFWEKEFRLRYKLIRESGKKPRNSYLPGLGEAETHVDVYDSEGAKHKVLIAALDQKALPEAKEIA